MQYPKNMQTNNPYLLSQEIAYFLTKRYGNPEISREAAEDACFIAVTESHKYNVAKTKYATWVYAIARNRYKKIAKKKKAQERYLCRANFDFHPESYLPFYNIESHEKIKTVQCMLNGLNLIEREIIVLRYLEERKINEIAKIMELEKQQVYTILYTAMAKIRKKHKIKINKKKKIAFSD